MITRRHSHKVPGLNTTSTADISFMLLIFFLVTSNMDVDKGLQRQLPPASRNDQQQSYAAEGTTLALRITADNHVLANDKPIRISELRARIREFIGRVGRKHLVTIDADPMADYDTYFHLQNELVAAYNGWRNDTSRRLYGRAYAALNPTERDHVRDICPQRVAEQYHGQEKGGAQ